MSVKSTQGFNDFPIPIGSVIAYAGGVDDGRLPLNYLICNGASLLVVDYPELFSVIGNNFGSLGAGLFTIPEMAGFIPKCDTTAGVISLIPTTGGGTFASIVLTSADIPTISGMAVGANISGGFPSGSSDSSQAKTDTNTLGSDTPMTSWSTTSTVDMTSVSPPVFNYNNGGPTDPVQFVLANTGDFVIPNVEMVFLIKTKNQFFPK